ncbi:MAG: twitching motility protein PilT [Akkermansiaceae bacterium]|jgi:twitching motility protein PilT
MAVIDTFLKLMVARKAERLVLMPDEVPTLFMADQAIPLSMPTVPADLMKRLALEVVGGQGAEELTGDQPIEGNYESDDREKFSYQVSPQGEACRIEMASHVSREVPVANPTTPEPTAPPRATEERRPDVEGWIAGDSQGPLSGTSPPQRDPDSAVLVFLELALEAKASDIFLSSGKSAQMRVNGAIRSLETSVITKAQILQLLPEAESKRALERSGSVDFGARWKVAGQNCRFRINVFLHSSGLAAALRPIRSRIPSLRELQLPEDLLELTTYPSGLVLVTGSSGSGKSTTLAALVDHINQTKARHIITIEDPIEFEHRDAKSLVHQREVGANVESFSSGLRAALRENPDVIMLGEMRDLPTISAALTAAETGHLVLSTLHTGHATAAVNRIIDVYPGSQQAHVRLQLASSLRAVVAQRLVPAANHHGRVPALEKLIVTPAVANSIKDGNEHHMQSAIQTGAAEGMITLERSLAALIGAGKITRETAFRYAIDQQALQKLLE